MTRRKSTTKLQEPLQELIARFERGSKSESSGRTGVIARSSAGRLFFIPNAQVSSLEIQPSKLYEVYRTVREQPTTAKKVQRTCERVKSWLDSHDPNSDLWRLRVLLYFENCV
jgi:hypothetical protein